MLDCTPNTFKFFSLKITTLDKIIINSTKVLNSTIPTTRLESYHKLISSGQYSTIKEKCLAILKDHNQGLTRAEISTLIDKKEHCLTLSLQTLEKAGKIAIVGIKFNTETNRNNQIYKLIEND